MLQLISPLILRSCGADVLRAYIELLSVSSLVVEEEVNSRFRQKCHTSIFSFFFFLLGSLVLLVLFFNG